MTNKQWLLFIGISDAIVALALYFGGHPITGTIWLVCNGIALYALYHMFLSFEKNDEND